MVVSDYEKIFYLNNEDIEKNKIIIDEFRKKGNIFVIATEVFLIYKIKPIFIILNMIMY